MSKIEGLETRRLMAAPLLRVGAVTADNRGEVVIQLSERATGVKGAAVQIYTAGTDGVLFTNDDVKQSARISYSVNKKQIKLTANLPKDTAYRLKLDGKSRIKAEDDGTLLDGNFTGSLASGDGVAGGNFEAVFNRDTGSKPQVQIRSSAGDIKLTMRGDVAPAHVSNFLSYANSKRYDNSVFTRSLSGFILQGGSARITGDGQDPSDVQGMTLDASPTNEFELSNTRGTVALAKLGGQPSSGTNSFFFNVANNAGNLDAQNGGFTVFAEVADSASLAVVDAIIAKPTANLDSQLSVSQTDFADAPVNNSTQALAGVVPTRDLIIMYRVASIMKISAKS